MNPLVWVISFIPGLLWLWFVYKKDRFEPEPIKWVLIVFFAGALSVIPTMFVSAIVSALLGFPGTETVSDAAKVSFLIAGVVEEGMKMAVVLVVIWKRSEFNEPIDGLVYASAAALGFASVENALYVSGHGMHAIIPRAFMSTAGHMLFSSMWGYALGRAKFEPEKKVSFLMKGFVLSAFLHGLYNFLLFTQVFASLVLFLLAILLWDILARMVKDADSRSPFKPRKYKEPEIL